MGGLSDGAWHSVALSVAARGLALYVDCALVEEVGWGYGGMDFTPDGLLLLGGILEGFETPFQVRSSSLTLTKLCLSDSLTLCLSLSLSL